MGLIGLTPKLQQNVAFLEGDGRQTVTNPPVYNDSRVSPHLQYFILEPVTENPRRTLFGRYFLKLVLSWSNPGWINRNWVFLCDDYGCKAETKAAKRGRCSRDVTPERRRRILIIHPTTSYSWTMSDDGDRDCLVVVVVVVVVVPTVPEAAVATGSLPAAVSEAEAAAVASGWKYGCWWTASARWIRCDGSYSSIFSMRSNSCRWSSVSAPIYLCISSSSSSSIASSSLSSSSSPLSAMLYRKDAGNSFI